MKNKRLLALLAVTSMAVGTIAMPATNVSAADYQVKRGDTLTAIARRHGVTVADLCRINGITNPNRIRVGQSLRLSQEGSAAVSARVTMSAGEKKILKEMFNAAYYAQSNPDVVAVLGSTEDALFRHFCEYGLAEGRQPNADFNVFAYKSAYPDLRSAFGDDIVSYYTHYYRYVVKGGEARTLTTVKAAMDHGVVVTTFSGEKCAVTADGRIVVGAAAEQIYHPAPSRPAVNPTPGTPVDPEEPDTPVDPEEPDTPVDPEEPDTPVDPEEPDTPVDPEEPDTPVDPEEPDTPVDPEEPDTPVDPEEPEYPILTDENGNVYDLGGMEIIIRDWWTDPDEDPGNEYEEATQEYHEWLQETYNFTITRTGISDHSSSVQDFLDYTTAGGDEKNYVFVLPGYWNYWDDSTTASAFQNDLFYDLSSLDCLDFTREKFTANLTHQQYSKDGGIYAMYEGTPEPRTGVYFNKRLLREAGIDPESLYDMQAAGTWTWDAFLQCLEKVQRDIDGDGVIDVYGANAQNTTFTDMAVFSNGGEYIGLNEEGKYTYRLEDEETLEGLEFAQNIFNTYWQVEPEGAVWDYYKTGFLNGEYAFMIEDAYAGQRWAFLEEGEMEDEVGFVAFPKGPNMTDYTNCWSSTPAVIPSCYDADRAWKIAFAWNLYTDETPGYENSDQWKSSYYGGVFDTRAVDETLAIMRTKGMITYDDLFSEVQGYQNLTWYIYPGSNVADVVSRYSETWKQAVLDANR